MRLAAALAVLAFALPACRTTVDSLGDDPTGDASPAALRPLTPPPSYPNAFRDVLGKTDEDIAAKLAATFAQLFHGDPATQAIYFEVGSDQALIQDILHNDIRTEGIGYGMIIAVELDKRDEFDRLWRYATTKLQYQSGPNRGYFRSSCDTATGQVLCIDPFGLQQFVMALVFAHDRWRSPITIDYGSAAQALLELMLTRSDEDSGASGGASGSFDPISELAFDDPSAPAATYTRPSVEMPAYYELWAQATGDSFWTGAAAAARAYWKRSASQTTGLLPLRASFDGTPVPGAGTFGPEGYRTQLNMVLDRIWLGTDPWEVDESNLLLRFFFGQGIDQYGRSYSLDGATVLEPLHDPSLVAVNGTTALIATVDERAAFIDAVWNLALPTGLPRYYAGILQMVGLLVLSGQYRVY